MLELAREYEVPLLRSKESTSNFMSGIIAFLNLNLAPRITRHGVLIEIYGEGVFITGESGVGKSETAIELVKRGIVGEEDINKALEYQKEHPSKKIGDILYELHIGNPSKLIAAIADILGEKPMLLGSADGALES